MASLLGKRAIKPACVLSGRLCRSAEAKWWLPVHPRNAVDRCHLIVGYQMPAGSSVLLKIPGAANVAKREYAVCEHLWAGGEPKHLVGPMKLVECGSQGFHTLDGAAVGDMQLTGKQIFVK